MSERLNKINEYKDAMLATVAHDLRTPLNSISIMINLAHKSNDIQEIREKQEIILKNCIMLQFLINDILDYSKIQ